MTLFPSLIVLLTIILKFKMATDNDRVSALREEGNRFDPWPGQTKYITRAVRETACSTIPSQLKICEYSKSNFG